MTIELKKCTIEDLQALQKISIETYRDTFDEHNTEENMKAYLDKAYNVQQLEKELLTKDTFFYFLYDENRLAGYSKININQAQTEKRTADSLEVERIYIKPLFKGKGFGKMLINKAIELAQKNSKNSIWLGVWEHNSPAQAFYEKMGFTRTGAHSFFMGDDEQLDFIMTKKLS
ncbi:GNAT family N-acetyltransferase [Jeotgalibaca ciconiae]|uniref:GNAT family N-acetyltransferase n=1 Tax=Jeotgalibaca ciconiae TaxID=2496265 RepID=A0A3Q9BJE3_9LACT|nr:GNAT family N-acetyltransferase [Jeotgalibaca ciconiae]AZP03663.1 GNAT family N-acetyltransferase [Jeotgalibaca ciconiae]